MRNAAIMLSEILKQNLVELIEHDKKEFDRPPKWRDAPILSSPLIVDFDST